MNALVGERSTVNASLSNQKIAISLKAEHRPSSPISSWLKFYNSLHIAQSMSPNAVTALVTAVYGDRQLAACRRRKLRVLTSQFEIRALRE
ncbi:hypothetical protein EVAR_81346_1 [Eumeta japonica]|uniref:Uncharacterized protein n=1 Tax=Eumeta variegata TaxID=151549 RepID=A0A4C1X8R9_EUMVA|nr:hypothetical protein EVAR_81346_1 [Eumeta japonica]